ncbi:antA/AntB antirepressor family protein [Clostridium tagluense]|uniref:AntA/AntB antirepressor domain-containing protein n=1 Tax=Clostridium tagluense TaxID=360422 RepID=A0A401USV2_9CLOT|nr:antA/AntB antirepressor family protein [Clostridium tagluense]GCD12581.1 hypothetical protein Ctaglu_42040 [Clostridium tagluense]
MNELIKVVEDAKGNKLVSARELHIFLESKQDFSTWIKGRIKKYNFIENEDFSTFHIFVEREDSNLKSKTTEYAINIDMAKELSMIEHTIKGKEARKYFIACEKSLGEAVQMLTEEQKLQLSIFNAEDKNGVIIASGELDRYRRNQLKEKDILLISAGKYKGIVDDFLSTDGLYSVAVLSKVLGIKKLGTGNLYKYLRDNKIIMTDLYLNKDGEERVGLKHYTAFASYCNAQQYFRHNANPYKVKGKTFMSNIAMFTPVGVAWIYKRLQKDDYIVIKDLETIIKELKLEESKIKVA